MLHEPLHKQHHHDQETDRSAKQRCYPTAAADARCRRVRVIRCRQDFNGMPHWYFVGVVAQLPYMATAWNEPRAADASFISIGAMSASPEVSLRAWDPAFAIQLRSLAVSVARRIGLEHDQRLAALPIMLKNERLAADDNGHRKPAGCMTAGEARDGRSELR